MSSPPTTRARSGGPVLGRARDQDGLAALEIAILMPVMLAIIFTMFQIALHWHANNVVAVAAEQAVNAGQVEPDQASARGAAEAAARGVLGAASFRSDPGVDVDFPADDLIQVTITAETPRLFSIGDWRVETVAQGRIEEFVPLGDR